MKIHNSKVKVIMLEEEETFLSLHFYFLRLIVVQLLFVRIFVYVLIHALVILQA